MNDESEHASSADPVLDKSTDAKPLISVSQSATRGSYRPLMEGLVLVAVGFVVTLFQLPIWLSSCLMLIGALFLHEAYENWRRWRCPHCHQIALRKAGEGHSFPGGRFVTGVCESCGKSSVRWMDFLATWRREFRELSRHGGWNPPPSDEISAKNDVREMKVEKSGENDESPA